MRVVLICTKYVPNLLGQSFCNKVNPRSFCNKVNPSSFCKKVNQTAFVTKYPPPSPEALVKFKVKISASESWFAVILTWNISRASWANNLPLASAHRRGSGPGQVQGRNQCKNCGLKMLLNGEAEKTIFF